MIRIPPRRRRTVTTEEHNLWRAPLRDTEPLPGRELDDEPGRSLLDEEPIQARAAPRRWDRPCRSSRNQPPPSWTLDGLHRPQDRRSAAARTVGIDGRIDLHGMTQSQAHAALNSFVLRGWHEQRRCLLVITARVRPDVGRAVRVWAYCGRWCRAG